MELNRNTLLIAGGLILAAALVFVGIRFYEKGYRVGLPGGIHAPGVIEIGHFDPTAQIFLDGEPLLGIPNTTTTLRVPVPAGVHDVTVAKNGYYPWEKAVDVDPRETVIIAPFAVPSATNGLVIPKTDAEYADAARAIAGMRAPTAENPLLSSDGVMSVFIEEGVLIARSVNGTTPPQYFCEAECTTEHTVITLQAEVRGVTFFPGRSDVLLIAVQNSIFAVELDTRGTQNFQPVYQGVRPTFAHSAGVLYVKDGESLFKVYFVPGR